ncbi:NADH:ubiquinone reductase (Na(+)-transporting) subunit A, partial [Xanthomonas citri pv. citri]|nr:NADH:ubiquinone reductase (Na(+)-transporting) subunit A [Xanthomonas citri pv. citri]
VPKLDVAEGDRVEVGSPLLHDKSDSRIKLVAPAAGTVEAVVRGARRKIERVVIKLDSSVPQTTVKSAPFAGASAESVTE